MALSNSSLIVLVLHEMHVGCIPILSYSVEWEYWIPVKAEVGIMRPPAFYNNPMDIIRKLEYLNSQMLLRELVEFNDWCQSIVTEGMIQYSQIDINSLAVSLSRNLNIIIRKKHGKKYLSRSTVRFQSKILIHSAVNLECLFWCCLVSVLGSWEKVYTMTQERGGFGIFQFLAQLGILRSPYFQIWFICSCEQGEWTEYSSQWCL